MTLPFELWPPAASHHARQVDLLIAGFGTLVWLLALPVFVLSLYFMIHYRRGRQADRRHPPPGNIAMEAAWAIIPFMLVIGFYVWSTGLFFELRAAPADALAIDVVARQWMWKVQHASGAAEINALHVPADKPIVLTMTSQDVIHSLYLPALRIKQDVIPGRYTTLSFMADRAGTYPLRCAEFCGTDHSAMIGELVVMTPGDYAAWIDRASGAETLAAQGAVLFGRFGCSGCHSPQASVRAPALDGIYRASVPLADGRVIRADAQYLHDSIVLPNRDVAAGYAPIMPTYGHLLSEAEIGKLVAYLKALREAGP